MVGSPSEYTLSICTIGNCIENVFCRLCARCRNFRAVFALAPPMLGTSGIFHDCVVRCPHIYKCATDVRREDPLYITRVLVHFWYYKNSESCADLTRSRSCTGQLEPTSVPRATTVPCRISSSPVDVWGNGGRKTCF